MNRITVRIVPNASKTELVSREAGVWKIRVAASAVEGKANEALVSFLADEFDCAPSRIAIVRGHTGKTKIVEIGD